MDKTNQLGKLAKEMRREIVGVSHKVNTGHVGSSLSIVDILVGLYFEVLKINPKQPWWPHRDRFILSKGHAALALYTVLAYRGFFSKKLLPNFIQDGSPLTGHPEGRLLPGIEATTGSLGHGLSVGVGMALAAKRLGQNYRVFVLLSDGECDEGEVWQAALFAAHHKLDNITVIIDYNKLQAFGRTKEVLELEPLVEKWRSFNWATREVDGHNLQTLTTTLAKVPFGRGRPSVVIAHTKMGKGVSFMEDKLDWHYLPPSAEQLKQAIEELR